MCRVENPCKFGRELFPAGGEMHAVRLSGYLVGREVQEEVHLGHSWYDCPLLPGC